MAEEGESPQQEIEAAEEDQPVKEEQQYQETDYNNPKCNLRIEELAKPKRLRVQWVYKDFKKILPSRNLDAIHAYLKEEFAKSPEDTEENFNKIIEKEVTIQCRKLCKKEAKRLHIEKIRERQRKNMLKIMKNIIRRYMAKAYFNPPQFIMTSRLRRVSNIIMKSLCELRGINIPRRDIRCRRAVLLAAVSDFFAHCVDTIYYELQVQKVLDYEEIQREEQPTATENETIGSPIDLESKPSADNKNFLK